MNAAEPSAVFAMVLLLVAGIPCARLVGLNGVLGWSAAWLFGCGGVAAGMALLSAMRIGYGRAPFAAIWLVVVLAPALAGRPRAARARVVGVPASAPSWLDDPLSRVLAAVCLVQVVYVFLVAVRVPLGSFDSWALWDYKGIRFWHDGGITHAFLVDRASEFAHPAYPPLVPLLIAWVYTWCGSTDPVLMKPMFALFFVALLLALVGVFEARFGRRVALLGGACLVLVPRVTEYAGTGLADVPLAAYVVAGAAVLVVGGRAAGNTKACLAAGALFGLALFTKHDAVPFVAAAMLSLAALRRATRGVLAFATAAALLGAPWYVLDWRIGVPDRDFHAATIANVIHYAWRIPPIGRLFALNMLAVDEWNLLWIAVAALALHGLVRRRIRAPLLLLTVLLPLAFFIASLSLSAWPDYIQHARTSLDRLILVTAPFGLWFAFEQVFVASGPETPPGSNQT